MNVCLRCHDGVILFELCLLSQLFIGAALRKTGVAQNHFCANDWNDRSGFGSPATPAATPRRRKMVSPKRPYEIAEYRDGSLPMIVSTGVVGSGELNAQAADALAGSRQIWVEEASENRLSSGWDTREGPGC